MKKQHIVNEIRRTAEDNGGAPLGLDRFSKETGIKYDDWFGKYWARWSDAIKEAGFTPNRFSTEGYGEQVLIERYVDLVRAIGRIPTRGEIGLRCQVDQSFPSEKAFRRLGSKGQLLTKLREYCSKDNSLADVLALVSSTYSAQTDGDEPNPKEERESSPGGSVYLIRVGRYYKIGKTNAMGRREYELAIQLPEKARTVHVIKTIDDATGIEAYWHRRFESKRANGEWFELDRSDIQAFKRRTLM